MQDGIIKGTGNSRLLKSAITEATTWEQFRAALIAGTLPIDLAGINTDGWQQLATALSKGNLLSDATAALINTLVGSTPSTPDAALSLITGKAQTLYNERVRIATGSYTGTGTSGSSSPNSIAIGFSTKLLLIQQVGTDTSNCWQALLFINPATKGNLIGITTTFGGDASASTVTWGLTNVSWYANNAIYQFNITGVTYNYFSVG